MGKKEVKRSSFPSNVLSSSGGFMPESCRESTDFHGLDESKVRKSSYFFLAVLGLSFWFFLGLPFASHRETYTWLAGAQTESFSQQFAFGLSSTYRPLSQVVTRLGYL